MAVLLAVAVLLAAPRLADQALNAPDLAYELRLASLALLAISTVFTALALVGGLPAQPVVGGGVLCAGASRAARGRGPGAGLPGFVCAAPADCGGFRACGTEEKGDGGGRWVIKAVKVRRMN